MVLIVGVAALAIDVASWYQTRHRAQVSADASALAAANCLVTGACTQTGTTTTDDAYQAATSMAGRNGVPASSVTFGGGSVTVTTSTPVNTFFSGFGVAPTASARAVASYENTISASADIYAQDCANPTLSQPLGSPCTVNCSSPGVTINTSGNTALTGAVQSNGSLSIHANNNTTIGDITWGDPAGLDCADQNSPNPISGFGGKLTGAAFEEGSFEYFPDTYNTSLAATPCASSATLRADGATVTGTTPPFTEVDLAGSIGTASAPANILVCATTIKTSSNNTSYYGVSLEGSSFSLDKNSLTFTADANLTADSTDPSPSPDLAIYDESTTLPLSFSGNNLSVTGTVYVPASSLTLSGNNGSAFFEANTVTDDGNNTAGGPTLMISGFIGVDQLTQ
jgi:hypothetical protein